MKGDDSQRNLPVNHLAVEVRDMEIDDLAPVYHLGEELFTSDLYPYLYRTWDEWEIIGLFNTEPEYCMVAEVDGNLAGFILGSVFSKASWTYGYIIWLGVRPTVQRKGIADKLVDKLVDRMIEDEGVRYMLVDTDPRNTRAVRFFSSKGFGNKRDHVYFSMNLSKHERYGRLIAREKEREKLEKEGRQRARQAGKRRGGNAPFFVDVAQEMADAAVQASIESGTPAVQATGANPPKTSRRSTSSKSSGKKA